jgi:hypothetical protein
VEASAIALVSKRQTAIERYIRSVRGSFSGEGGRCSSADDGTGGRTAFGRWRRSFDPFAGGPSQESARDKQPSGRTFDLFPEGPARAQPQSNDTFDSFGGAPAAKDVSGGRRWRLLLRRGL